MTLAVSPPPIVVDASLCVGAIVGEPASTAAWAGWIEGMPTLLAPPILVLETANALVRRHRMPAVEIAAHLDALFAAGVEIADRGRDGVDGAVGLAERHGLSVCDAAYLWLAIDVDGELATLDRELARAAAAEGVPLAVSPGPARRSR